MAEPRERPILFSAPMVRALLAGTKTQTRRVVKAAHPEWIRINPTPHPDEKGHLCYGWDGNVGQPMRCPYGAPGDRLWVRESFNNDRAETIYRADGGMPADWFDAGSKWCPSIHMPRRASRITLEITEVRVERLRDISEADAGAEGVRSGYGEPFDPANTISDRRRYQLLWEQINGPGSWDANPWVWAVSFRRITP